MTRIGVLSLPDPAVSTPRRHGHLREAGVFNLLYNAIQDGYFATTYLMRQVPEARQALISLGRRLRRARLARNESMAVFAERIRVSERTVRAMERGQPTVQIGTWLEALWVLDELQGLEHLLEERESLLDRARREESTRQRQRASRRGA